MKVSFEDGNYSTGYNLDHAALNGLDVMHKVQVTLALYSGEGVKLIFRKFSSSFDQFDQEI